MDTEIKPWRAQPPTQGADILSMQFSNTFHSSTDISYTKKKSHLNNNEYIIPDSKGDHQWNYYCYLTLFTASHGV